MSQVDDEATMARLTLVLQILIVSLIAGLVTFLGIVAFIRVQNERRPLGAPAPASTGFTTVAVVLTAAGVAAAVLVPRLVVAGARKKIARGTWRTPVSRERDGGPRPLPSGPPSDRLKLASVYQTQLIIAAALTEGPAFVALIAYLLEGTPVALGLALALIAAMAARLPTRARLEQWIDQQLQLLAQEREFGD